MARDKRRGIPQGSPLSPLLANLYMRRFMLGWKKLGHERPRLSPRHLCGRLRDPVPRGNALAALDHDARMMGKLKLTVNEDKTRLCGSRKRHSTSWATRSANVLRTTGKSPHGPPPVEEEHQASGGEHPRDYQIGDERGGCRRSWWPK